MFGRTRAILRRLGKEEECSGVEVGVWKGENALNLLTAHPKLHLNLVDPWDMDNPYLRNEARYPVKDFAAAYKQVLKIQQKFPNRCTIARMLSVDAAIYANQETYDFVFIDGEHSYDAVASDLAAWFPAVKQGGYICGHDYKNGKFPGVTKAVKEFAAANKLNISEDIDHTFFISKT